MKQILFFLIFISSIIKAQSCFEIKKILVDACGLGSQEAINEMVYLEIGNTTLNTSNLSITWPNNNYRGICQNAATASKVDSINAIITNCGFLKEPVNGNLPAFSKVILIGSTNFEISNFNFQNFSDTAYIIFQCSGNLAGHFANYNLTTSPRTLIISFSNPTACYKSVTYDRSLLTMINGTIGQENGASVLFDASGNASYVNNGCQATFIPILVDAGNNQSTCFNSPINLTCSASGPYNSLLWSGGSGTFSSPNTLSTNYLPGNSDAGTIKLYLNAFNTCGNPIKDSVSITILPGPNPQINLLSANDTICNGESVTLSASGGSTYSWSNGATTNTVSLSPSSSTVYTVTATNSCSQTNASFSVTVNELSNITVSNNGPYCPDEEIQLNADAGYNYNWSGPNSFSSTIQNPTIVQVNSATIGTYSVVITDPITNCQSTFTTNVVLNNLPLIDVTSNTVQINPASCGLTDGSVIGASAIGNSPFSYYWTNNSGTVISNSSNLNSVSTGVYYFVAIDANGCKDSSAVTISNLNGPPVPTFQTINPVCEGNSQTFTVNNPENGATYTWSLGSTVVQTGIDLVSLTVSGINSNNVGPYTVEVNTGGCNNFASISGNIIPKPMPQIDGVANFCAGNSIILDASSSTPSSSIQYSWYLNSVLIPNETSATLSVNSSGIYQVMVSANGCDSISEPQQINVNPLPIIDITNQVIVQASCGLNNASVSSINVTGNSPFTYNWTNGAGTSFTSTLNLTNASAGQYYFVATDVNGCKDSTAYQLTSIPAPQTPLIIAPSEVCEGSTAILSLDNVDLSISYTWNFNGSLIQSGTGLDSLVITNCSLQNTGNYEIIASNGTCSADTTILLTVNEQPLPQISATELSFCDGNSSTLSVGNNSNFNYQWFLNNNLIQGENNSTIDISIGGTYQVLVSNNGCDSLSVGIVISELPAPLLNSNSVNTCLNQPTQLSASGADNYSWQSSQGQFIGNTISIDSSIAGVYTFTLTGTNLNGCTSDTLLTATINNNPTVLINGIQNDSIFICDDQSSILLASGALNYLWSNLSTSNPLQANFSSDTTVAVVGTDINGCSDSSLIFVKVHPAPVSSIILGTPTICNGYPTQLYLDTVYTNQTYSWLNSTGNLISSTDSVMISNPGLYYFTTGNACRTDTLSFNIGQSTIQASFFPDTTLGIAPLTVNFSNTTTGATNYYWLFGNGDTTNVFSPSTLYQQPGTYIAYLLATNPQYCFSTYTVQIIVLEEEIYMTVPTVFSPNGDGVNDEFFVKQYGLKSLNCKIYNRWGNLIYELENPDSKWKPGNEIPEGTYYFIAEANGLNQKPFRAKGYLLLVR